MLPMREEKEWESVLHCRVLVVIILMITKTNYLVCAESLRKKAILTTLFLEITLQYCLVWKRQWLNFNVVVRHSMIMLSLVERPVFQLTVLFGWVAMMRCCSAWKQSWRQDISALN